MLLAAILASAPLHAQSTCQDDAYRTQLKRAVVSAPYHKMQEQAEREFFFFFQYGVPAFNAAFAKPKDRRWPKVEAQNGLEWNRMMKEVVDHCFDWIKIRGFTDVGGNLERNVDLARGRGAAIDKEFSDFRQKVIAGKENGKIVPWRIEAAPLPNDAFIKPSSTEDPGQRHAIVLLCYDDIKGDTLAHPFTCDLPSSPDAR